MVFVTSNFWDWQLLEAGHQGAVGAQNESSRQITSLFQKCQGTLEYLKILN